MRGRIARELAKFLRTEDGPTAVEYAVMLALIIVVCAVAVTTLGQNVNSSFQDTRLRGVLGGGT